VVRDNAGTFEYLDASEQWVAANDRDTALAEATLITNNQMTATILNTIPMSAYTETPSLLTVTYGVASEDNGIIGGKVVATSNKTFPEGTDVKWRIRSITDSPINIHGVSLSWN
jgi:hypothetical protein